MKKRLLSWLLVLTMVISLIPSTLVTTAFAAGDGVNISGAQELALNTSGAAEIKQDGTYTVTGNVTQPILIGADAVGETAATKVNVTLVLNGLKINSATSPIQILGGSELTLVLADGTENVLNCTKTGNAGEFDTSAGAGILCELGAKLTIDKAQGAAGTGSLTVTGGYGGAGIGGGRFDSLYTGDRAATGGSSTRNYNLGSQVNWQGGAGGIGGRHGANAGTAGSVTINAGVLNITGGLGGAGIGGGMGAAGEAGAKGNNANSVVRFDGGGAAGSWFGTGGGGGGAGGNGGRGGSGGDVTINGGAVTVTGGRFTLNRSGKTVDVIPASIGGGAGGIGGNGGDGGSPANSSTNQPGDRWGTKGGIGQTGYMNYNGDGGNLIVNGGTLSAVGNIRVGDDANRKGIQCAWADRNQGYTRGGTHCGYAAGIGAEATVPTLDSEQKALNIQIKGSENNVRFLDYDNTTKLSAQPTDKNSKTLYEVTLTVRNKTDDTVVSSANVEVAVNKADAAAKYTYKTVSDLDGKATLWLPKGEYSLSYFDVNRSDVGIIQQGDGKTFTVEENNNNAEEVKIGLNVTASASLPNTNKVYINDTTTETNTPLSIKIDATGASNSSLDNIKWFREKVNGNSKTYALYQTVNEYAFDASGYDDVTNPDDKGELTVAAGTKEAELKVLENGRYWLKIPMTVTDPNDTSKSMTVNLIRLVEVKNIYRSFPIQVKHQDLDRDGKPHGQAAYQDLTYGNGTAYNANYGFAWDLHGYKADNVAAGTLLAGVTPDTVDIYALNIRQKPKWYEAALGSLKFARKTDRTDYEKPVTLTLDQAFLTNSNADMVGGKKDISKYTITYTPDGVPVAEVTIRGIVLADGGVTEKQELWKFDNAYPEGVTEATITGFAQKGYKIDTVRVNGVDKKADLQNGNSIHLQNLQGTQVNNYNDAIEKVEFVYVDNMMDVTVNCVYNGATIHQSKISLEKGVPITVSAPTVAGYTAAETGTTITPDDGNNTVTFTYTKNAGNVTVVAVDAGNGNTELYRKDGGTVAKGDKINLTGKVKAPTIQYYTAAAAPVSVTVNGVDKKDDLDTYKYEGNGEIVVTYAYTRNTRDITVIKKDVDTNTEIGKQKIENLAAGQSYTFGTAPAEVEAVANYTAVPHLNPTTHFLEDKDGQTVIFWYKKNDNQRYVTVTVNLQCDEDGDGNVETFRTYPVTAIRGAETTIKVPDMTGMGYSLAAGQADWTGKPDDHTVVNFQYVLDGSQRTVTVKLLGKNTGTTGEVELSAPNGYQNKYLLKTGESVTIQAPHIDGYDPVSADLFNGAMTTEQADKQKVTVSHGDLTGDATVTFHYEPKSSTSFVTHTIKFMVMKEGAKHEVYSYSKLIPKGTGAGKKVEYKEDDVKYTLPGYAFADISYTVGADDHAPAEKVTDLVDATITYHFEEDAAQIVIKQNCTVKPDEHSTTVTLTGYRKGQTDIKVMAPLLADHALAPKEPTFKTVGPLEAGANEVTFNYVGAEDLVFELVEVEIKNGVAEQKKVIQIVKAKVGETYNPTADDNVLNLTALGYDFVADNMAADPFKPNGTGSYTYGTALTVKTTYTVCYTKKTRDVDFVAVDKTELDKANKRLDDAIKDGSVGTYTIPNLSPVTPEKARVGETYKAVAQSFSGWALRDDYSKYYEVADETGNLKVYFMYVPKATGTVVIKYSSGTADQAGMTLNEYSFDAVSGEKVSITPPTYILNGKYKLRAGQNSAHLLSVEANQPTEKTFYYEPNFVTVTVNTVTDGGAPVLYDTREVNKTDGNGTPSTDSLTLTPPNQAGYTLVGIIGVGDGTAATLPTGFNGSIQLTGWNADKEITYYYAKTTAAEYQYDLTVQYLYNSYALAEEKTIKVSKDQENSIDVPTFDGYLAKTYQLNNGTAQDVNGNTVSITPTADKGTLVIHYGRTDGTIVLPGGDNKIPAPDDADNVVVKPGTGTTITGPETDGSVKIPENGTGTVTRPIDPANPDQGKEEVKVPGGTVIKPDGSIVLPTKPDGSGGGTIKPDDKLPGAVPAGYRAVVYKANGGVGDDQINIYRDNETIRTIFNPFTNRGKLFTGWSTAENGVGGTEFGENAEITGTTGNVTFYAQWGQAVYAHSTTITYLPNDGTADANKIKDTVGANDSTEFSVALRAANTFIVTGWTFGGWNTEANGNSTGTLKAAGDTVTAQEGVPQTWYAQWYKEDGSSITVPGKDGNPNNEATNVTGSGTGISREPTTGVITIPDNGTITVTKPDGERETILLPNGGTLNPDGSYTITQPDGGKIEVDKDGKEESKDNNGDPKPGAVIVVMAYHINNGTDGVMHVKAVKGEKSSIITDPFKWDGYTFLNWMGTDKKQYNTGTDFPAAAFEFYAQWAKKNTDGSIELPGTDGKLPAPNDKDNVIVTPGNGGTLDGPKQPDGSVEVKGDEATVTRPIDPAKPDQGKENIKVPEGSIVYPDGTIKLPDGTIIKPEDKFPDAVVTEKYVVMTYEPNGGGGHTVRKVVDKNVETTTLPGTEFTAPSGKEFKSWLDVINNAEVAENSAITPTKDLLLRAQWKDSAPITTTYSAEITFESNNNETAATQTLTGTTGEILTGKLNAYAFTPPAGWKFMGWSTAKAASQNAAFYADGATVTLKHGEKLTLYAILYKLDANTGVATLPGKDGQPEGGDDVTVNPPAGGTSPLVPGNGFITAPTGSEIKQPANANPIKVIEGEVNVYPDGSVFVPEGSKVTDKDGNEVTGPSIIKPDGSKDEDANKKPIQKPDGTIVLPGQDGTIGTGGDDITVKPNGGKPAGRIDETTGNVTITDPNGADVKFEGKTPENVKVPVGSIIEPDGTVTLAYTIRYVDGSGRDLHTPAILLLKENAIKTVKYVSIDGYAPKGDQTQTITGKLSENPSQYTITFTYDKQATGGNTGGGSSGGGGGSSGGGGGSSGGSAGGTTNPTQPDTKPTPGTKPNDPTQTGIANWLRTDKHTTSMTGYGNGLFGPEDKVTRAQVAQIFYRLLKDNNVKVTVSFTDVPDDAWYATAVNTLGSLGIVGGIGDGRFDPNRPITRAEFCVIATRFAKVVSTVENPFSDINAQDWYYTAVTTAASYDWVTGMGDGSFRPYDVITRAQAATIINRMLGAAADRAYVDEYVTNPYRDVAPTHWAYYQIMEASIATTTAITLRAWRSGPA